MTIAKNIQKLASCKERIRSRAYRMLKTCGSDAVPQLIAAFESRDLVVRYRVAMLLGKTGDSRALHPLMAHTCDTAS